MKVFVALAFLATLGLLAEARYKNLKPRNVEMPVFPKYTAQEWRDIYAAQVEVPKKPAVVKNAVHQPAFAGKVHVKDNHLRITNGQTASRGQFPWQVALIIDGGSFCGGSILSNTVVLTAAHCAGSSYQVILGANRVDSPESEAVILTSRQSTVHQNYNPSTINNDIALVFLPQSVGFNNYISPIRLPSSNIGDLAGVSCRVSGWGLTYDGSSSVSSTLQFVDLTVITNNECASVYGNIITPSKVCVATPGGRSTCSGDSGGPLVVLENDGQYSQVGIVSFGAAAGCELGYPAAFTRVSSFLDWIQSNARISVH